jgi:hypothetical protein
MNINFKCGYYYGGRLIEVSADLNADKDYYIELKKLLKIKRLTDYPLIRIGEQNRDGGYIMANNFQPEGIAYSFGINNDTSWDLSMARYDYDIFMYDHTIDKLPSENSKFHFFKEGISGTDEEKKPLKTLKHYIEKNEHSKAKNMILKMDVEGAEWDFLENVDTKTLKQFDQIVFEMHNLVRPSCGDKALKLLEKLNKTHQLIHLHGNNSGYLLTVGDTIFPDVIETSYVNKNSYYTIDDDYVVLPSPLDMPNDLGRPDVPLGLWNTPVTF